MKKTRKKVIVNYQQEWSEDRTHYTQQITLDKKFLKYINKNIKYYHDASHEVQETIADSVGFSTYYDCYLEPLDLKKSKIFLTLTQLSFIFYYLHINNYDIKRIKRRNTLIKVI